MRDTVEWQLHPVERPACLHDRHVECLAVVGDDGVGAVEKIGNRREQRPLTGVTGQEKLAYLKSAEVEVAAADEKGQRSGAARQTCSLEVDEDGALERCVRGQ